MAMTATEVQDRYNRGTAAATAEPDPAKKKKVLQKLKEDLGGKVDSPTTHTLRLALVKDVDGLLLAIDQDEAGGAIKEFVGAAGALTPLTGTARDKAKSDLLTKIANKTDGVQGAVAAAKGAYEAVEELLAKKADQITGPDLEKVVAAAEKAVKALHDMVHETA